MPFPIQSYPTIISISDLNFFDGKPCLIIFLTFSEWDLGSLGHYAGHHCSWCYDPQGIRTKLESAQKHDKPRWGDFPEKTDLKYIAGLIREGGWFDDTRFDT